MDVLISKVEILLWVLYVIQSIEEEEAEQIGEVTTISQSCPQQ